jgi:hypothetical protein
MSWVYFLERSDGMVKIGYTSQPGERLHTLEAEHGPLLLRAVMPGARPEERSVHERFAPMRDGATEWFVPGLALHEFIEATATQHGRISKADWAMLADEAQGERLDAVLFLRYASDEKRAIVAASRRAGFRSVSEFIRQILDRAVERDGC